MAVHYSLNHVGHKSQSSRGLPDRVNRGKQGKETENLINNIIFTQELTVSHQPLRVEPTKLQVGTVKPRSSSMECNVGFVTSSTWARVITN